MEDFDGRLGGIDFNDSPVAVKLEKRLGLVFVSLETSFDNVFICVVEPIILDRTFLQPPVQLCAIRA